MAKFLQPFDNNQDPLWNMMREFDGILGRMRRGLAPLSDLVPSAVGLDDFDLEESDDQYLLRWEIPGVRQEDLKIDARQNAMTISAQKQERAGRGGRQESTRIQRTFTL